MNVYAAIIVSSLFLLKGPEVLAQDKATTDNYSAILRQRTYKILAPLGIADSAKFFRVQQIVTSQYQLLSAVHDSANARIKSLKTAEADKEAISRGTKMIDDERMLQLAALHKTFINALSAELTPEQLISVKDGMTYGILPITVKAYEEMLLSLTPEQKVRIINFLTEAREYAMDAESSEKKHAWFGKYKGKINNYLSAAGYDMKKEGEEWQKRISAKKAGDPK